MVTESGQRISGEQTTSVKSAVQTSLKADREGGAAVGICCGDLLWGAAILLKKTHQRALE